MKTDGLARLRGRMVWAAPFFLLGATPAWAQNTGIDGAVDAGRDGHRADDDAAWAGALLLRHGAQEERARHYGPELRGGGCRFATAAVSAGPDAPNGYPGLLEGNAHQVLIQLYGVGVTVAYCAVSTSIILLVVAALTPLRVHPRSEIEGLDIAEHGESIHA